MIEFKEPHFVVCSIHDEDEDVIKYEDVVRLHIAIDEHILESSGLNLNHYLLKRFSIPRLITLDSDGKVRKIERFKGHSQVLPLLRNNQFMRFVILVFFQIDSHKLGAFDLVCRFINERKSY